MENLLFVSESCTQHIFAVVTGSKLSVVKSMNSMTIIQRQATIDAGGFDNPTWQGIRVQNDGVDIPVLDMFPGLCHRYKSSGV